MLREGFCFLFEIMRYTDFMRMAFGFYWGFFRFVGDLLGQIYIRCYRCSIVQLYDIQKSLKMVVTLSWNTDETCDTSNVKFGIDKC